MQTPTPVQNSQYIPIVPRFSARSLLQAISLALLLLLTACNAHHASKQTAIHQIVSADAAISQSIANDARTYAPLELRLAERKLEDARSRLNDKDYFMAHLLAEQVEIDAQFAEAKAQASKAENVAAQLEENNQVLENEIKRASSSESAGETQQ